MALPVHKILWAPTNKAHHNHLHVEGSPHVHGDLGDCTSRWTPAIQEIVAALNERFGRGGHYQVWDDTFGWTHMGVYNCRPIAGTNIPSQHAFSNAIDIGPYYGVAEQQKFYDFLTGKESDDMQLSDEDVARVAQAVKDYVLTIDVPDVEKNDGKSRRGWTHALKQAWRHSFLNLQVSSETLKLVKALPTSSGGGLTEAQIRVVVRQELDKTGLGAR